MEIHSLKSFDLSQYFSTIPNLNYDTMSMRQVRETQNSGKLFIDS